jgi:hypothetical protein
MIVLVDFDNIPRVLRNRGLDAIIDRILNSIGTRNLASYQRIRVKLYGGWYSGRNLTRAAQDLATAARLYPKTCNLSEPLSDGKAYSVIVAVELAETIEIDRGTVIENTYREGGEAEGIRCIAPPYARCVNTVGCPLLHVHDFINTGVCPENGCNLSTRNLLRKAGQKLVDTMMTADLIYFAINRYKDICVTSSDDDLWPGIKSALLLGSSVIQLRTQDNATAARYTRNAGPNYTELKLR